MVAFVGGGGVGSAPAAGVGKPVTFMQQRQYFFHPHCGGDDDHAFAVVGFGVEGAGVGLVPGVVLPDRLQGGIVQLFQFKRVGAFQQLGFALPLLYPEAALQ